MTPFFPINLPKNQESKHANNGERIAKIYIINVVKGNNIPNLKTYQLDPYAFYNFYNVVNFKKSLTSIYNLK